MKIDGISNSIYGIDSVGYTNDAGFKPEETKGVVSFGSSFDEILGFDREKKSILGDGSLDSIREQAKVLKDNLAAIFNKMDTGVAVEMDGQGVDVNNTEVHRIVTVVEQIQMKLAMYCDDFEATADIDIDAVRQTMGNGAAAYRIAEEFGKAGIPATKQNVSEALEALSNAAGTAQVSDSAKAYLMQNKLRPTINNIYLASHAGTVNSNKVFSEGEWQELKPQIEKIIVNAGMEPTGELTDVGRWMLERGIEVTAENFAYYEELDNVQEFTENGNLFDRIIATMIEGYAAKDTLRTGETLPWEEAAMAIQTISEVQPAEVMSIVKNQRPFTVDELIIAKEKEPVEIDEKNVDYITANRKLQEARLIMTFDSLRIMEKSGISVNTTDISEMVEMLKALELKNFDNNVTTIETTQVNMTITAVDNLRYAHCAVIGSVIEAGETATVNSLTYHHNEVVSMQAQKAYEALSTEIRSDLGDSKAQAIAASMEDILSNLGYDDNEENRRAVRILAYNDMDITGEYLDKVKSLDTSIQQLFKNITPEKTLRMIRDNINPLETAVEELSEYLYNLETEEQKVEKYSEFLYRMDKNGAITPEEREKFIGVYSLVRSFNEGGKYAVGQLMNQGLELNMGNLLSAYFSQKGRNMDMTAGDDTKLVSLDDRVNYYKALFREAGAGITPDKLHKLGPVFDSMSVEEFSRAITDSSIPENDPVYQKYIETAMNAANVSERILKEITDYRIPATYNNILAAQAVTLNSEGVFKDYKKRTGDETIEDRIMEAMESKESLNKEYENVFSTVKEMLNKAVNSEKSYVDMETMRQIGNNMRYINSMAKQNNFIFPYENENRSGIINLKVIENSEKSGALSIEIRDSRYGRITVDGKVRETGFSASIMCSDDEIRIEIEARTRVIEERMGILGMKNINIKVNHVTSQPQAFAHNGDVETQDILKIAKIFIEELTK